MRDKMNVTASWNIWGIKFKSCRPHQRFFRKAVRFSDCAAFLYVSVIAFGFSPEFRLEKCRKICYTSVVSIFRGKDPAESAKNHRESP